MEPIFVSICIPAYKSPARLTQLLQSISIQSYKHYEVVVTDDSGDDSVEQLVYSFNFPRLTYVRNATPLGSPENWNEGIRRAKAKWIKIMHDDDWFAHEESLRMFVTLIERHPHASFFFCNYYNVRSGFQETPANTAAFLRFLASKYRELLIARNIIGPPSVTLFRRNAELFDHNLKWLVDIEFYVRYGAMKDCVFTKSRLIKIGISEEQVTFSSSRVKNVEIPEYLYVLTKRGPAILNNIFVYDAYWRLIRNFQIRESADLHQSGYKGNVPQPLLEMIACQRRFSPALLNVGIISKLIMLSCYIGRSLRRS